MELKTKVNVIDNDSHLHGENVGLYFFHVKELFQTTMFVCLCKAVSDHDIHGAVEQGVSSFEELQAQLEVSTVCGTCECEAKSVFDQKLASEVSKRAPRSIPSLVLHQS